MHERVPLLSKSIHVTTSAFNLNPTPIRVTFTNNAMRTFSYTLCTLRILFVVVVQDGCCTLYNIQTEREREMIYLAKNASRICEIVCVCQFDMLGKIQEFLKEMFFFFNSITGTIKTHECNNKTLKNNCIKNVYGYKNSILHQNMYLPSDRCHCCCCCYSILHTTYGHFIAIEQIQRK